MTRIPLHADDRAQARATFRNTPLFAELDENQLERVLDHTRLARLDPEAHLFEQDQPATDIYLLESGRIKLSRISPEGQEKVIHLVAPGNTFAEAVLFSGMARYPVTAIALNACRVYCIDLQTYSGILHESIDACFAVMARLSRRLHEHVAEIDRLTLHNATFRVIAYLLDQIPEDHGGPDTEIRLDIPKHVIAARVSITPETLSRTFSRLQKQGWLSVQDNLIVMHDLERLRQYIREGA